MATTVGAYSIRPGCCVLHDHVICWANYDVDVFDVHMPGDNYEGV